MSLAAKFKSYIKKQQLFGYKDHLILAVSGGVDSVVLCELCKIAGFNFKIAHCNFQLRGEESERDETFVKSLGEKYGVQVFIKKFDTEKFAEQNKVSIQVAARELRYEWFEKLRKESDNLQLTIDGGVLNKNKLNRTSHVAHPTYLLTAHHANDNIETLLMNFFKGTGVAGLRAIQPRQGKIIRPLLFAKKEDLLNFASENNLRFVEDSSNLSDKYTRNYFRNQLIPSLQKVFPGVEENLINNIERFGEIDELYRQIIRQYTKKLIENKGNEIHTPVLKLKKIKALSTVLYEIIKEFGFTAHQADEAKKLLDSESGKYISSATHKIIKNRNWIIIAPHNTMTASNILIEENEKEVKFEDGILKFEKTTAEKIEITAHSSIALLDADKITFPLLLRKWKRGDYFYPLGMKKTSGTPAKKKLGKFFIDQKLSIVEKEKIWIIESNKKIIWVVGRRIDDRFKVISNSTRLIKIHFNEL